HRPVANHRPISREKRNMPRARHGFGFWAVRILVLVMIIFGLPIAAGGAWLLTLGGSWYYLFAGLGLIVSAIFLWRHEMAGVWIYLLTFAGTLVWALWERGMDGWAQMPRLFAPTIILVLVLVAIPALKRSFGGGRADFAALMIGLGALGVSGGILTTVQQTGLVAQETPAPEPEAEA